MTSKYTQVITDEYNMTIIRYGMVRRAIAKTFAFLDVIRDRR